MDDKLDLKYIAQGSKQQASLLAPRNVKNAHGGQGYPQDHFQCSRIVECMIEGKNLKTKCKNGTRKNSRNKRAERGSPVGLLGAHKLPQ